MSDRLSRPPRATDRGAWRLVAARDFRVRLRDKGFFISTGITLSVLTVFIVIRAVGGGATPSFDLGLVGDDPAALERTAAELRDVAARASIELRLSHWDDVASAEPALRSGRLDAALDGADPVGDVSVPPALTELVRNAVARQRLRAALDAAGTPASAIEELLNQPAIRVRTLEPQDPDRDENAGIAFIAVLLRTDSCSATACGWRPA